MNPLRRCLVSIGLLLLLTVGGTASYMRLEEWPLHDALYMTVITMSTVGFREVATLSEAGELFTVGFILMSLTLVGFVVASITAFVVHGELHDLMKGRRMQRQIEKLEDHYILCGCGAVGQEILREFVRAGVRFVVVEQDPEAAGLPGDVGVPFLEGDATDEDVLERAGIRRAKGLISVLRNDPENVFVTLTGRQLNPGLHIVARSARKATERKLRQAGADRVISPYEIAGQRIASMVLRPNVYDFLDVVVRESGVDLRLEEFHLAGSSELAGHSLRESDLGRTTGAVIVGVQNRDGRPRITPASNVSLSGLSLTEGDILIALGNDEQLNQLRRLAEGA